MISHKKILIVEDNQINRAMLKEILSKSYEVLEAGNGQEALDILKHQEEEISLILLDIIMPIMDGYTFLDTIKADPLLSAIPVIVTTQSDREEDEVLALSRGATDFVAKPYRPQIILHRVASIIHLRETAAMVNSLQYDSLTGLYNKEFFFRQVRELLGQHPNQAYDIICSDIENFKLVNDIFGIQAGDRLLKEVAELYRRQFAHRGICGRFNADRFMCMIEHPDSYSDEMFLQFNEQINAHSDTKNLVLKWGIYTIHDAQVPVDQMCDRALLAADSIKGQYQKIFSIYDDTLRRKLLREQSINDSMESALENGEFLVYFQPKYSLSDDRLAGAEALIRWQHPTYGFLSPGEFIPLFEKNGFITRLDQFVWDKTCSLLRSWSDLGYPIIPVSVNVSRSDIYQSNLPEYLSQLVKKYDLPPSCLHLEITESAYTENPEQIINTVTRLRMLGFIIEMDDFGSGYSSLNMLNQMPLDVLKLDMKFIQSETAKPMDQGILRFIMSLARWMNLTVVAEGVETREQLDHLKEIGCDYVQGYFFAKPMQHEDFENLLKKMKPAEFRTKLPSTQQHVHSQFLVAVDEDPAYLDLVESAFSDRYQVIKANDYSSAAAFISGNEYATVAVILSLTLPENGGFELLGTLRDENSMWRIPIMVTAPLDLTFENRAMNMGADDIAFKPHTMVSMRRWLFRLLGQAPLIERQHSLQKAARQDYLTRLLNRRGFYALVEELSSEDLPAALYFFDLDDLKLANDRYGHDEGDKMLTIFSDVLRSHTRKTDILSRYGGDEFVVIVKGMSNEESVLKKGTEICQAFQASWQPVQHSVTCSVGAVIYHHRSQSVDTLISQADQALYQAKSENKGGCLLWKEPEA